MTLYKKHGFVRSKKRDCWSLLICVCTRVCECVRWMCVSAGAGGMARRLVLNGLTAEVRAGAADAGSPDSLECYHELELYRLLARPAPTPSASPPATPRASPPASPAASEPPSAAAAPRSTHARRRARTPDPPPAAREHGQYHHNYLISTVYGPLTFPFLRH